MTLPRTIPNEMLERELAALTSAPADSPALWEAALRHTGSPRSLRSLLSSPLPVAISGSILGLFVLAVLISVPFSARLGASRGVGSERAPAAPSMSAAVEKGFSDSQFRELDSSWTLPTTRFSAGAPPHDPDVERIQLGRDVAGGGIEQSESRLPQQPEFEASQQTAAPERYVIRKAQIDIRTEGSVRVAFLKAQQVISEARGEYIESASLTGEGKDGERTIATLTLRVTADRLSQVLGSLRELGIVASESAGGEDVTNQVVDLEARLRNEQRIETELLELLASRQDASLAEILQLRTQIASVREQIERFIAQRERLSRLVSLATILVTIHPVNAEDEPVAKFTISGYFTDSIERAWNSSLRVLVDTAAFFVRVAVGGLVWWVLLLVAILAVRTAFRKRARLAAAEPAPAL
jgi:hypothetical protein